jgi:hypothetical protein
MKSQDEKRMRNGGIVSHVIRLKNRDPPLHEAVMHRRRGEKYTEH